MLYGNSISNRACFALQSYEVFLVVGKCLIAKAHLMVMFGVSSVAYQNRKQTLSPFYSLRRA